MNRDGLIRCREDVVTCSDPDAQLNVHGFREHCQPSAAAEASMLSRSEVRDRALDCKRELLWLTLVGEIRISLLGSPWA